MNVPGRAVLALLALAALAHPGGLAAQEQVGGPPPPPPARAVPGINAPDPHPRGCVDCHVVMKEANMDVRLSTLMSKLSDGVEPKLLEHARAAASDPAKIKGRHPRVDKALGDIPAACLTCHGKSSQKAPPFSRLLHAIHLTGGDQSHFLTIYQGECTHCHKLDLKTGAWHLPSGAEP